MHSIPRSVCVSQIYSTIKETLNEPVGEVQLPPIIELRITDAYYI